MRGSEIISHETLKSGLTTALTNSIPSVSRKKKGLPRLSDTGRTKTRRQRDVEISRNAYIGVCATINGRCFYVNPVLSKLSVTERASRWERDFREFYDTSIKYNNILWFCDQSICIFAFAFFICSLSSVFFCYTTKSRKVQLNIYLYCQCNKYYEQCTVISKFCFFSRWERRSVKRFWKYTRWKIKETTNRMRARRFPVCIFYTRNLYFAFNNATIINRYIIRISIHLAHRGHVVFSLISILRSTNTVCSHREISFPASINRDAVTHKYICEFRERKRDVRLYQIVDGFKQFTWNCRFVWPTD